MLRAAGHLLLLAALATGQVQVPVANFTGTVHDISKKQVTIDTGDGNLLDFEINRKTKVMRAKKEIKPEDIMTGDQVTIEGRQEMLKFLVAVTVTVQPPKESR
jgi:DNA/RNA endonuclease YhcR with UshA esterase domain